MFFKHALDAVTATITNLIAQGANSRMTDKQFLEHEISRWENSPERMMQIKGFLYFEGNHDILYRKREMIGENGELQEVKNLPNNHIVDNRYAILVNQKANYLLGNPFVIDTKNEQYAECLNEVFNKKFMRMIKNAGKASMNGGIAWLFPYYDEDGEFSFRMFPAYEILPFWHDRDHTKLDCAIRLYLVIGYEGTEAVTINKVEIYDKTGIHRYIWEHGVLTPDVDNPEKNSDLPYLILEQPDGTQIAYNWNRIPLIPVKFNENEKSLLKRVKSLQDALNVMLSDFENNMQEDNRNTILILKNYDGQDLGEFRRNLATFGAVKVRYDGEAKGGVETLEINVNGDNYQKIIEIIKKAIIENGMGYDAKDDRLSGNPNQMNIQSMYSDIDLDANDMETELQATFDELLWFINVHLANTGKGDYENEDVKIVFNRDMMINESDVIKNCRDSVGIISDETIVAMHPWINDVQDELAKLQKQKEEKQKEMELAYNPFNPNPDKKDKPDDE